MNVRDIIKYYYILFQISFDDFILKFYTIQMVFLPTKLIYNKDLFVSKNWSKTHF